MKTATKQIQFDQLMKVFTDYVSKLDSLPSIKYVHFDGKYLVATNSHILLRVNIENVSDIPEELKEGSLYNPKEMQIELIESKYPEINRLIPRDSFTTVQLGKNINELHKEIKEAKRAIEGRIDKIIRLKFTEENTTIYSRGIRAGAEVEYENKVNSVFSEGENATISLNSRYLDKALAHVKKLSKLGKEPVTANLSGRLKPIYFKQEDVFDLLILPIREM